MRAAVLYGREDIRIEDLPAKPLEPGQVRMDIRAALTCGTDLKVFRRGYHAKMITPPAVFGHELSGIISEISPGVASWKPGDRVVVANSAPCGVCYHCQHDQENLCTDLLFLNGAYAESIVVPARLVQKNMLRIKAGTGFADAALTEPLACVVQGVQDCDLNRGQKVLIIGSGPIGLMFVALAKSAGCTVTLAGRGEKRLHAATRLGADQVVDVSAETNSVPRINSAAAGSSGFDVVIEAVGKPQTWEEAVQLVRKGGRVNFFGGCPSGTTVSFPTELIHYSNLTLLASFHHTPRTIRRALELIESGVIQARDFVDGNCPLGKLPGLFQSMCAGNRAVKTLIDVKD